MKVTLRVATRGWNGAGSRVVIYVVTLVIVVIAVYLPGWTMAGALALAGLGCTLAAGRQVPAISMQGRR